MNKAGTSPEKKRAVVFKTMSKEGQDLVKELEGKLARLAAGRILTAHRLGELLSEAHGNQAEYATDYIEQMARYQSFPGGARTLHEYIAFAKAFSRDYVKEVSLRVMPTGATLDVDHWLALTRVADEQDREVLLDEMLAESWSSLRLAKEIEARAIAVRNPPGPGRRRTGPTSPIGGLGVLNKRANSFINVGDILERAVFRRVHEMSNSQVSQVLLDQLQRACQNALKVRDTADDMAKRLAGSLDRVRGLLALAVKKGAAGGGASDTDEG